MNSSEETAPMHLFTSFSNVTLGEGGPGFLDRGFKFIKGGLIC